MFTLVYKHVPNTRVRLKYAIGPALLAAIFMELLQRAYVYGQVFLSSYNAIYGSFAAIPLLLFFINIAWCIILFGVELTYVSQNIRQYNFSEDIDNVSHRFRDFSCLLLMSIICKRFREGLTPFTVAELSEASDIPYRLAEQTVNELETCELIYTIGEPDAKADDIRYVPAVDIAQLTVGYLLKVIDTHGSEDFKVDCSERFAAPWKALVQSKQSYYANISSDTLLAEL